MTDKAKYGQIKTLSQLREERRKLKWQIRYAEDILRDDVRRLRHSLSFGNIVRTFFESRRADNIYSLTTGVFEGFRSLRGLFKRMGKKRSAKADRREDI